MGPGPPEHPWPEPWPGERARHGGVDEIPLPSVTGRLWVCGKHFVGPDPEAALEAVGAQRIVCLCEERELSERYPGYPRWLSASPAALWFPIPDLHVPPLERVVPFLGRLRSLLADGDGLLMHCGAGIGRAGTVSVALLMTMGMERGAAQATVADHRPMAGPEAGAQVELLGALATHLRTAR